MGFVIFFYYFWCNSIGDGYMFLVIEKEVFLGVNIF